MVGGGEIYVEFITLGNTVKATAIDPASGLEASIVGPASAPRAVLAENARKKLEYVKAKRSAGESRSDNK
ncbi:MAG TPA: hypothetical protein VFI23_07340 [Rhizomicrobium sp.]|nr:hypothetical protein [Rhizomicrobium sp.]